MCVDIVLVCVVTQSLCMRVRVCVALRAAGVSESALAAYCVLLSSHLLPLH
jgi:hypothetical protein